MIGMILATSFEGNSKVCNFVKQFCTIFFNPFFNPFAEQAQSREWSQASK